MAGEAMVAAVQDDTARILVVDDDDLFRESLQQNLIEAGFDTGVFPGGEALIAYLAGGGAADLVLLDWRMPGMTGIEVLRHLRARGFAVPVIFLTVLSDQIYEEAALIGGAVDFVEKSRSFTILRRRIALIMDGPKAPSGDDSGVGTEALRLGPLTLHPDTGRALWSDRRVGLTLTEYRIVDLLARRAGGDIRYREIYDLVRGEGFVAGLGEDGYRANVRAFIKRIRHKFREVDDGFDRIENYPGFGYRWRADP